jgi:inhibitor of cysteine peptidase
MTGIRGWFMKKDEPNHTFQSSSVFECHKEDSEKSVFIKIGDEILIHLKTTPATGFDWVNINPDTNKLVEVRNYKTIGQALGGPSELQIHYRATASGHILLLLHYCRPWEKDIPPLDIFKLDITIEV